MLDRFFYVYILTNKTNNVLYVGVTNNLQRRILEHRNSIVKSFTRKYNINKCVYYEQFTSAYDAIAREKQLKSGSRSRKIRLINKDNPEWNDLYEQLFEQ